MICCCSASVSYWYVLQGAAVVLQCVAVCCRVLQCVPECCIVLQCVAVMLQGVAV